MKRWIGVLLVGVLMWGCTPAPTEEERVPQLIGEETLPPPTLTPLRLPSLTASPTLPGGLIASPTLVTVATEGGFLVTATPPNSPTPSVTRTPSRTPSLIPTRTFTPSRTPTPSITPTIPTRTLLPTWTSAATLTSADTLANAPCVAEWFFSPAPPGCPLTPVVTTQAAFQRMERGVMIWLASGSTIFVLFTDGQTPAWIFAPDTYQEGDVEPNLNPPPGFLQPGRGFGKLWANDPILQARLGWAVSPETAYTASIQADATTAIRYLSGVEGEIYVLPDSQQTWWQEQSTR